jgi:hypothetical protein
MDGNRFDHITRRLGQRTTRRTAMSGGLAAFALAALHQATAAQEGTPDAGATPAPGDEPVFMFVQTFGGGRGEVNPGAGTPTVEGTPVPAGGAAFLVTLEGHTGQTVYFSDRPDRIVGTVPTENFLETLGFTPHNPPNAALVAEFQSGQGVIVLELIEPTYDPDTGTLVYGAEVLEGYEGDNLEPVLAEQVSERLPAEFGPSALFIDDCPDIDTCMKPIPFGWWPVGPIPGGPYGACWQGVFQGGCEPCHYTYDYLKGLCNDGYPDECKGRCDVSA